jgi:putative nucleotidyltransferase with HDIG domain
MAALMRTAASEVRAAALAIVRRLRSERHEAYFVGGCVRDELLGRTPPDYDVSTSALPEEVMRLFPRNVPVGAQFGVVIVMTGAIPVEVATFRSDDAYVDGRRPTGVRFTGAREDAERRDFTVNGLFLDPETGEILDFVGGRADLDARLIRAIGDPRARFGEDRLRLLRAVRFATTLPARIEPATWSAVREMAHAITEVSWERIRVEVGKILVCGNASHGFRLLHESGLLAAFLPEVAVMQGVEQPPEFHPEGDVLVHTLLALQHFDALPERPEDLGLAVLLHDVGKPPTFEVADRIRFNAHDKVGAVMTRDILKRMRYPNAVVDAAEELVARHMAFVQIRDWREAKLRRFLGSELIERHMALHRVDCLAAHGKLDTYRWCQDKRREFATERPRPPRLVTGDDLLALGYRPGPLLGKLLASVDDERLEGRLTTREEALTWLSREFPPPSASDDEARR